MTKHQSLSGNYLNTKHVVLNREKEQALKDLAETTYQETRDYLKRKIDNIDMALDDIRYDMANLLRDMIHQNKTYGNS